VRLLVEKEAKLESKGNMGSTSLSDAARIGHEAVVRLLPVSWAAERGQEAVVRLLLEKGA
jgi:ankyrin repeat protein